MSGANPSNDNRTNLETTTNSDQELTKEFIRLRDSLNEIGVTVNPEAHDRLPVDDNFLGQFSEGARRLMEGPTVDITGAGLSSAQEKGPVPGPTPPSPSRLGRIFTTPGVNEPKGDDKKDE